MPELINADGELNSSTQNKTFEKMIESMVTNGAVSHIKEFTGKWGKLKFNCYFILPYMDSRSKEPNWNLQ